MTGPSSGSLPSSERYALDSAFFVQETGLTYFVGTEDEVGTLFSWAGEGSEPKELAQLGAGRYSIIGFLPTQ